MSRHGTQNRFPADEFCSKRAPTMYPKFRGLWYLVDREFRTSRRALNVLSVRAGLPEQATLCPAPRDDEPRKGAAMAGKPQTLATTSAFEILGPVMVGPSSSHTAGALRCAQVAASLLEGALPKSPLACGTPSPTPTAATVPTVRSSRASWASTPTTRTSSRPLTSQASRASNITLTSRATTPPSTQHRRH